MELKRGTDPSRGLQYLTRAVQLSESGETALVMRSRCRHNPATEYSIGFYLSSISIFRFDKIM